MGLIWEVHLYSAGYEYYQSLLSAYVHIAPSLSDIIVVDRSWCLSRLACWNCPLGSPTQRVSRYADYQVGTSAAEHVELGWGVSVSDLWQESE